MKFSQKPEGFYSKKCWKFRSISEVEKAIKERDILHGLVYKCDSNNNLLIELGKGFIGVIPYGESEYHVKEKEIEQKQVWNKVNKVVCFYVTDYKKQENGDYLLTLSRKEVQKDYYEQTIKNLKPGDILEAGVVFVLSTSGVICDIGCGYKAMLPINRVSTVRYSNLEKALGSVKNLLVAIKEVDLETGLVQITHRELLHDWETEVDKFKENEIVVGTITYLTKYGAIVELSDNLSGYAKRKPGMSCGDNIPVRICSIMKD